MVTNTQRTIRAGSRNAMTLVEVLIAMAISSMVLAVVMETFLWCGDRAALCVKIAWSQKEALQTAEKLTMFIRNACAIERIDEAEGEWVELRFTNGLVSRLSYSNIVGVLRSGRMYLTQSNATEVIVVRGMTEIMESDGFTTPIFTRTRPNVLHVSFRLSEPTASGSRAADDEDFAAYASFGVCLRNVEK